jgi:hypothetical protein
MDCFSSCIVSSDSVVDYSFGGPLFDAQRALIDEAYFSRLRNEYLAAMPTLSHSHGFVLWTRYIPPSAFILPNLREGISESAKAVQVEGCHLTLGSLR